MRFVIILFLFSFSCGKSRNNDDQVTPPVSITFAKGADISWLTEMESSGRQFYNSSGAAQDCIRILNGLGMNAVRLRVWVDPAGGWCNTADVLAKAVRAKNMGMRIMIDFHYSDTWADPGQQTKPAAWAAQDFATLQTSVYNHTFSVLSTLKANSVFPEWVQIGNETNDGMLWPTGKASVSMANFSALINKGYEAVKAVDNNIKVVVHISNAYDNSLFRWIFDGLKANGGRWDVIGMSIYPSPANWSALNSQCLTNMSDMVSRYNTPIMICESGMSWDQPSACNAFLSDLIVKVKSLGNNGLGVFYWEPECYNGWKGYTLGAFDNTGKPTAALNAFQ